jgi:hypothetical protein
LININRSNDFYFCDVPSSKYSVPSVPSVPEKFKLWNMFKRDSWIGEKSIVLLAEDESYCMNLELSSFVNSLIDFYSTLSSTSSLNEEKQKGKVSEENVETSYVKETVKERMKTAKNVLNFFWKMASVSSESGGDAGSRNESDRIKEQSEDEENEFDIETISFPRRLLRKLSDNSAHTFNVTIQFFNSFQSLFLLTPSLACSSIYEKIILDFFLNSSSLDWNYFINYYAPDDSNQVKSNLTERNLLEFIRFGDEFLGFYSTLFSFLKAVNHYSLLFHQIMMRFLRKWLNMVLSSTDLFYFHLSIASISSESLLMEYHTSYLVSFYKTLLLIHQPSTFKEDWKNSVYPLIQWILDEMILKRYLKNLLPELATPVKDTSHFLSFFLSNWSCLTHKSIETILVTLKGRLTSSFQMVHESSKKRHKPNRIEDYSTMSDQATSSNNDKKQVSKRKERRIEDSCYLKNMNDIVKNSGISDHKSVSLSKLGNIENFSFTSVYAFHYLTNTLIFSLLENYDLLPASFTQCLSSAVLSSPESTVRRYVFNEVLHFVLYFKDERFLFFDSAKRSLLELLFSSIPATINDEKMITGNKGDLTLNEEIGRKFSEMLFNEDFIEFPSFPLKELEKRQCSSVLAADDRKKSIFQLLIALKQRKRKEESIMMDEQIGETSKMKFKAQTSYVFSDSLVDKLIAILSHTTHTKEI